MPRNCQRQQHCLIPTVLIPVPFLNHLISDLIYLEISKHVLEVACLQQALLPTFISENSSFEYIKETADFCGTDLINFNILDEEFARWKISVPLQSRPKSLRDCLAAGVCSIC